MLIFANMNKEINSYIQKAQPFARPILEKLRAIIHGMGVEIEETIKWGSPVFVYHGNLCMTWAFKEHAAIFFFKGALMKDPYKVLLESEGGNVSSRSIRFTNASQVNVQIVREYLEQALEINKKGLKIKPEKKAPLAIPEEFTTQLKKHKKEYNQFQQLAPSHQREYVQAFMDAKKEETRLRRFEKMLENLRKVKE
jgi:uncharacterized protein YdeI (YjbR/CyaY-like superfamily)